MPSQLILLLVFPVVCALIGWITNVLAVRMIFRPYVPVRVMGITIQGVLPKHHTHFANMLAGIIVRDFVGAGDLVDELASDEAADAFEHAGRELAKELATDLRADLPESKRALFGDAAVEALIAQVSSAARAEVPSFVAALRKAADDQLDLEAMVAHKLVEIGARGLEAVIYEVSRRELVFIEYYGGVFGAILGLVQFAVLYLLGDIALPLVGALVGTATNWLAIQMLFYPREPRRYFFGLIPYQGMFPRRQDEIAATLGLVAARDFIVPGEIFHDLAHAVVPETLEPTHLATGESWLRSRIPPLGALLDSALTATQRDDILASVSRRFTELRRRALERLVSVASQSVRVDHILSDKLAALDKSGFEKLIRGLFEREELYLIIYGGILGGLLGGLQLLIVAATR